MTLLTVTRDVCAAVGVVAPTSVFSNITANRTMQEMLALANEMAQRIAYDTRDWIKLRKTTTMVGDGTTTGFDLPSDFKRMLLTSNVWLSSSVLSPARFVPDTDQWLNRRARNYSDATGEWTIIGNQLLIAPAMGSAVTSYFAYLHKNCIDLLSGGQGDAFINDGDKFTLDERLLKLGMIWQWKAQKGTPYQEDLGTYEDALAYVMGHDSPSPIIAGRGAISSSANVAIPTQTITVPVYPTGPYLGTP
jgi:hypothetical protein